MIARVASIFRGRNGRAKGAALLAAAATAISGYAFAIAPTVDSGRGFDGAVTLFVNNQPATSVYSGYAVPAGRQYTLTDLVVSNSNPVASYIRIGVGNTGSCNQPSRRTHDIFVPASSSLHVPFQTGLGFGPGKLVCISIGETLSWTLRGYISSETE